MGELRELADAVDVYATTKALRAKAGRDALPDAKARALLTTAMTGAVHTQQRVHRARNRQGNTLSADPDPRCRYSGEEEDTMDHINWRCP